MPGIYTERATRPKTSSSSEGTEKDAPSESTRSGTVTTLQRLTTLDRSNHHLYITGLRGILVIQSFLWTFFYTFIPGLVSRDTPAPVYQDLIREILSVPLWNGSLIYNFFVILSMRTIAVSFLTNPTGQTYAATVIRRIIRMTIIVCVGAGMSILIFSQIGTQYIDEFKNSLPNRSITAPTIVYDAGAAIGSLFNFFWITRDFYLQAVNTFWPTATLWVSSIIYFQSFTVYFLMVILPFTRPKWHIQGLGLFALGSFWMAYWGWYSVTGLLFADIAINNVLKSEFKAGFKVRSDWRVPYWAFAIASFAIGIAFKYAFIVRPRYTDNLLVLHPYLDLSERYSTQTVVDDGPYARIDDWFVIVGIMIAVELFETVQYLLSFKPIVWLGERSFSVFVAQCIFLWTGGIKLWLVLHDERGLGTTSANGVVFLVGLLGVAVFAELFYRLVDLPSKYIAGRTYTWLVE